MKIIGLQDRPPILVQQLLEIWEKSGKATHLFLSDWEGFSTMSHRRSLLLHISSWQKMKMGARLLSWEKGLGNA